MKRFLPVVTIVFGLIPPAAWAVRGELSGVVIDALTGRPIEGATVSLLATREAAGTPVVPYAYVASPRIGGVRSDRQGRFVLRNVTSGTYFLHAAHEGYGSPRSLAGDEVRLDTPFRIEGDESKQGITVRLVPASEIRGKVTTENGIPVEGARVYLIAKSQILGTDCDVTDAAGAFVFSHLFPGDYAIQANPPANLKAPKGFAYGLTYHAFHATPGAPKVLSVGEGERLAEVDVVLRAAAAQTVAGRLNMTGSLTELRVTLRPLLGDPIEVLRHRTAQLAADGSFLFHEVAPGRYVVKAAATALEASTAGPRERRALGEQIIDVRPDGHGMVQLDVQPVLRIRGRVRIVSPSGGEGTSEPDLNLSFRGREMPWRAYGISTKPNAAFEKEIPQDGSYEVELHSSGRAYTLQAIRVNGKLQPAQELRFPAGGGVVDAELIAVAEGTGTVAVRTPSEASGRNEWALSPAARASAGAAR